MKNKKYEIKRKTIQTKNKIITKTSKYDKDGNFISCNTVIMTKNGIKFLSDGNLYLEIKGEVKNGKIANTRRGR